MIVLVAICGVTLYLVNEKIALGTIALLASTTFALRRDSQVVLMLAPAIAVGTYTADRIGISPNKLALLLYGTAVIVVLVSVAADHYLPKFEAGIAQYGPYIAVACVILRFLPVVGGREALTTGQLLGVQLGEVLRPVLLLTIFITLVNQPRRSWAAAIAVASGAAYLLILIGVGDLGPAVLLTVGAGICVDWSATSRWARACTALLSIGAAVAGLASGIGATRLQAALDPSVNNQISQALAAATHGGLVGDGSSPYLATVAVGSSDMLPSLAISLIGAAPFALVVVLAIIGFSRLQVHVLDVHERNNRGYVALIGMLQLALVWSVGANVGILPLTGISAPTLVMTGSALLPTFATTAIVAGYVRYKTRVAAEVSPVRHSTVARWTAGATASITMGSLVCAVLPPSDSVYEAGSRARVLTADGQTALFTDSSGTRKRTSIIYSELGTVDATPNGLIASGLDSMQAHNLTCGAKVSGALGLETLLRPARCKPLDVVTSLDGRLQQAVADATSSMSAQVVVLDSRGSKVKALYSTSDDGRPNYLGGTNTSVRWGVSQPGSVMKVVTAAAALQADVDTTDAPRDAFGPFTNENGFTCPSTSVQDMVAYSCNTTAAFIASQLGQQGFEHFAAMYFGFGQTPTSSGVDQAYDGGLYATPTLGITSASTASEIGAASFGLGGVRMSDLNMAMIGAVLANRGNRTRQPSIVEGVCNGSKFSAIGSDGGAFVGTAALPSAIGDAVVDGMSEAVSEGTAMGLRGSGVPVVAKTGTVDVTENGMTKTTEAVLAIVDNRWVVAARVNLGYEGSSDRAVRLVKALIPALGSLSKSPVGCPK